MKSIILETKQGTAHTHVHEPKPFTVTKLVSDVVYTLEETPFFTCWFVSGKDANGEFHKIDISRAGLGGQSRFCGIF